MRDWELEFIEYDRQHPELYLMFEKFAYELVKAGRVRISHGTIIERLRWESMVGETSSGEYKVNQNFGRPMALRFIREFPEHASVFEFRKANGEIEDTEMARKPGKKKADAKNPATASLLAALKFIEPASKDSGPTVQVNQTHCALGWNWAVAFDGVIALACKIDTDIIAYPNTKMLLAALSKCDEQTQITQLDDNRIAIKSGRFSAYIPCIKPELFFITPPDPPTYQIDERVPVALGVVGKIANEHADRQVLASVLLRNGSAVATDGHIIFEAWHGWNLPTVVVPKAFISKLTAIPKKPVSLGYSQNTITIYFEDESWIRTQLYPEQYPNVDSVLNTPCNAVEIPKGLWEALVKIQPMQGESKAVIFNSADNAVQTHIAKDVGATCIVQGVLPGDLSFDIDKLRMFELHATTADFMAKSGSGIMACFYGDNFRGMLMSMRRHALQGEAVDSPEPSPQPYRNPHADDDIPF